MNKKAYKYVLKAEESDVKTAKISSSKDMEEYLRNFFFDDIVIYESFFLLMLNRANNVIGYTKISQGGIIGTYVDIKIICKYAIESLASSVVLCHNHPSGNLKPSEADIGITKKVRQTLELFDVKILDHIILTDDSYYSFADNYML